MFRSSIGVVWRLLGALGMRFSNIIRRVQSESRTNSRDSRVKVSRKYSKFARAKAAARVNKFKFGIIVAVLLLLVNFLFRESRANIGNAAGGKQKPSKKPTSPLTGTIKWPEHNAGNDPSAGGDVVIQNGEFIEGYEERTAGTKPWVTALPIDKPVFPRAHVDDMGSLPFRKGAKTIAIITLGVKPIEKYGGIGTMFYNYVQLYLSAGFKVHLYYCGSASNTDGADILTEYLHHENLQIHFMSGRSTYPLAYQMVGINFWKGTYPKFYGTSQMQTSTQIYTMLKYASSEYPFDAFLFHDYRGIAAATIQAKRSGLAFHDTSIIVTCHTSSYNSDFFNARQTDANEAVAIALEDYTRNYADVAVFVSHALRDQLAKMSIYENVETPAKVLVLPNFVFGKIYENLKFNEFTFIPKPRSFAFFGRLDTLKGVDLFIDAVKTLVRRIVEDPKAPSLQDIVFIGDYPSDSRPSRTAINDFTRQLGKFGVSVKQYNNLMTAEAATKMVEEGYIAVLPSLYDNFPMGLLEMLTFGVPVIHGDAGGTSEVSKHNYNMFLDSSSDNLADLMMKVMKEGLKQDVPAIAKNVVYDNYVKVVSIDSTKFSDGVSADNTEEDYSKDCSDVTVAIVTFLGRSDLVKDLLDRLLLQTCDKFNVILFVNSRCDQDTCGLELGKDVVAHFGSNLRIIIPPKGTEVGVGEARNIMIREAHTEYTILFDDDDVPRNDFIEVMKKATVLQGADLMATHASFVKKRPSLKDVAEDKVDVDHISLSAGNTGPVANFLVHHTGKANVVLRTSTAKQLGPCLPELSMSMSPFVDWGMYTRFILHDAKIGVVPEPMYYYKMNSKGSIFYGSNKLTNFLGAKKIVNEYCRYYKLNTMGCEVLWMNKQLAIKS